MGILNVTSDSFSDGGRYRQVDRAIAHGLSMAEQGADIIDVGGESVRPGAQRVNAATQVKRVERVIQSLRSRLPLQVVISIDTTLSTVAAAALRAGADMINDISAGRDDPSMLQIAAEHNVPVVLMHMQGIPQTMQENPHYQDVVEEIVAFLRQRAMAAQQVGVYKENIILDPGIGFGKTRVLNLKLLANLKKFVDLDYPILLGVSRKRFMGSLISMQEPVELVPATCAVTALGVMAGVAIFRVHDVFENRQVADVTWEIKNSGKA